MTTFTANSRDYVTPGAPVVVICVDGSEPAYHQAAVAAGLMPWLEQTLRTGTSWPAHCAMPALTNPNNVSIATGHAPSVHGISGNFVLDPETGRETMMNDPSFLRAPTIFETAEAAGLDVAVVTAKDKLRRLLGSGLERGTCESAEQASDDLLHLVDRPRPDVYSAELSELVLAAGVRLLETRAPDLLYLSLSDYVQHKHPPGTAVANDFYAMLDRYAAQIDALGAVLVVTADHGMSAKSDPTGAPRIIWLEDEIRSVLGDRAGGARVVLPITDPYVVHHGALGSFACVHVPREDDLAELVAALRRLPGLQEVHGRDEAAVRFSLPVDRIGDIVLLADAGTALGHTPIAHDLSGMDAPLRSHGALGEIDVPFIVNRALPAPREQMHNYDAFWVATTLLSQAQVSA
jgi:phosphonoacetate hydrolase